MPRPYRLIPRPKMRHPLINLAQVILFAPIGGKCTITQPMGWLGDCPIAPPQSSCYMRRPNSSLLYGTSEHLCRRPRKAARQEESLCGMNSSPNLRKARGEGEPILRRGTTTTTTTNRLESHHVQHVTSPFRACAHLLVASAAASFSPRVRVGCADADPRKPRELAIELVAGAREGGESAGRVGGLNRGGGEASAKFAYVRQKKTPNGSQELRGHRVQLQQAASTSANFARLVQGTSPYTRLPRRQQHISPEDILRQVATSNSPLGPVAGRRKTDNRK